jgi:hypothetical protein
MFYILAVVLIIFFLATAIRILREYERGDVENRIKEGKNTLRWDKTSCHRFAANEARLKMGFLAYNMLHLIRRFYLWGEDTRRSIEWIIMRLVKAGARIAYHARRWYVHIATAFPLRTITGLCSVGNTELACPEKRLEKL